MGVGTNENPWWNDVLENGPASPYGAYFDIAWRSSLRPELQDKVLLRSWAIPTARSWKRPAPAGLRRRGLSIHYYDRRFPVAPRSYDRILATGWTNWSGPGRGPRAPNTRAS